MIAVLVKLESQGPVIFPSPRVGRKEKTFRMYKFRTMIAGAEKKGPSITPADDLRVTRLGAFLRKYKLNEWPQQFNFLKAQMKLVGPRPEVLQYVNAFREDYREILASGRGQPISPPSPSGTIANPRSKPKLGAHLSSPDIASKDRIL
jgi:lipopolysaccharide/colanic/teichoic acid biosynthesis glycosyltransferase